MKTANQVNTLWFFLIASVAVCRVDASPVVYEDFQLISGDTAFTQTVNLTAAGPYKATLVDFAFPDPFAILAVGVTQGDPGPGLIEHGVLFGTDLLSFNVLDISKPLNLHLVANPGPSGVGLYGLQILSVPIPSALWLFLSAVAGFGAVARRVRGPATI